MRISKAVRLRQRQEALAKYVVRWTYHKLAKFESQSRYQFYAEKVSLSKLIQVLFLGQDKRLVLKYPQFD